MTPKNYCSAPFQHIRIDSSHRGAVFKPCCVYLPQSNDNNSLDKYLNSTELQFLKKHFLSDSNDLPAGCIGCKEQENLNQPSWRTHFNNTFSNITNDEITRIEAVPSNTCNLKCVMCSPECSTSVGAEQKKLGLVKSYYEINNSQTILDAIENIPSLSSVALVGGEFFLTKDNLKILELLIQKNLKVEFTTNATILLPEFLEKLSIIKDLKITISIDGIESSYEFMRYPGKWATTSENIITLKQKIPHAIFISNFVVQVLNLQYLIPTANYLNKLLIPTHFTNIIEPNWLTCAVLTKKEIQCIIELFQTQIKQFHLTKKQHFEINNYIKMLNQITPSKSLRYQFISNMSKILKLRKVDKKLILDHFGVLTTLANEIINLVEMERVELSLYSV